MAFNKETKKVQKILVIEDEADMCLLLELLLDYNRIEIDHVHTLLDAKEFLDLTQPSLILLDNRLPDGLGIDFISYAKAKYPAVRIIMISGMDPAAQDVALEEGADVFISKPFTKAQLDDSVKALLN